MINNVGLRAGWLCLMSVSLVVLGGARAEEGAVSGKFTGNGKPAKLAFISASKGDMLADKPTIKIVMTEKDHSRDKKPWIKAGFGDFGSALIITVFHDGKICGCEVAHTAHERPGFSSLGDIATSDFKMESDVISGKIATHGEVSTFRQKWEVKLEFKVKVK